MGIGHLDPVYALGVYNPSEGAVHKPTAAFHTFAWTAKVRGTSTYYKYYGRRGVRHARRISMVALSLRRIGYGLIQLMGQQETRKNRLELLRTLSQWNYHVDPVRLVEDGQEPSLETAPTGRVLER